VKIRINKSFTVIDGPLDTPEKRIPYFLDANCDGSIECYVKLDWQSTKDALLADYDNYLDLVSTAVLGEEDAHLFENMTISPVGVSIHTDGTHSIIFLVTGCIAENTQ
jgi:hypothetical protein